MRLITGAVVAIVCLAAGLITWTNPATRADGTRRVSIDEVATHRTKKQGRRRRSLQMLVDYPAVVNPKLFAVKSVKLSPSTEVIGVDVAGEFCAFVLDAMVNPRHHVVNLILNNKPLSVTYFNLADSVRVVTGDGHEPIPLRVGGLDAASQMLLLLDGKRYGQLSNELPLVDHEFVRMPFAEWAKLHPTTAVYCDPNAST